MMTLNNAHGRYLSVSLRKNQFCLFYYCTELWKCKQTLLFINFNDTRKFNKKNILESFYQIFLQTHFHLILTEYEV